MTFQNRQATHPGRIKLIPVAGQDNVFDVVLMDGATQEGTPLSAEIFDQFKNSILEEIAIMGTKGEQGLPGQDGKTGPAGRDGTNGLSIVSVSVTKV